MSLWQQIQRFFDAQPDVLYACTNLSYSEFHTEYRTALVFAVPFATRVQIKGYCEAEFHAALIAVRLRAETLSAQLMALLARQGVKACAPPVAQRDEMGLCAPFSFKYAAMRAGLGWMGKNDVIITERYGPHQRLCALLIDAPLPCGEPMTAPRCPEGCDACVRACPHHALTGALWTPTSQRRDLIDHQLCNRMRSAYIAGRGRKHECGLCLAACPIGSAWQNHQSESK